LLTISGDCIYAQQDLDFNCNSDQAAAELLLLTASVTPSTKKSKRARETSKAGFVVYDEHIENSNAKDFHLGLTPGLRNMGIGSGQVDSGEANRSVSPASTIGWSAKKSDDAQRFASPVPYRSASAALFCNSASSLDMHPPNSYRKDLGFSGRYIQSPAMFDCLAASSESKSSTPFVGQFDVDISAILSPDTASSVGLKKGQSVSSALDILAELASARKQSNPEAAARLSATNSLLLEHEETCGVELLTSYTYDLADEEPAAVESSALVQPGDQSFASFIEMHENLDSNCATDGMRYHEGERADEDDIPLDETMEETAIDFLDSGGPKAKTNSLSNVSFEESGIEANKTLFDEVNCSVGSFIASPAAIDTPGAKARDNLMEPVEHRQADLSGSEISAMKRKKVELDVPVQVEFGVGLVGLQLGTPMPFRKKILANFTGDGKNQSCVRYCMFVILCSNFC
jgi:hypothetical protein